jgi:hypothetical protein
MGIRLHTRIPDQTTSSEIPSLAAAGSKGVKLTKPTQYQTVVAVIGILLIASLWGITVVRVDRDYHTTVAGIQRENGNLAKAFEEQVRQTLKTVDNQLQVIGAEYERNNAVTADLKVMVHAPDDKAFDQLRVTDNLGNDVAAKNTARGLRNVSERAYFRVQKETGNIGLFIDKPNKDRTTQKWEMYVSRRMNNPDGSFKGVVAAALNIDYFSRFYKQMQLGEGTVIALNGMDGVIRARMDDVGMQSGSDISKGELFQQVKQSPAGFVLAKFGSDGELRFTTYQILPDHPLFVIVAVRQDKALAGHWQFKRAEIIRAFVASFFILVAGNIITRLRKRELKAQQALQVAYVGLERQV